MGKGIVYIALLNNNMRVDVHDYNQRLAAISPII